MTGMRRVVKLIVGIAAGGALAALLAWGGREIYRTAVTQLGPAPVAEIPFTTVKRGTVSFTVHARGDLRGGNSQMLTAPMAGGGDMIIRSLRQPGELVNEGDVVVQFDTTDQAFKLREAQADLAETDEKVIQAEALAQAKEEEDNYAQIKARADVKQAELDVRKNPLISVIAAKQADLALESARATLAQLDRDLANRKATSQAGVEIQRAAHTKAQVQAEEAQRNIDSMSLHANAQGYFFVMPNSSGPLAAGMQLPSLQVGDTVRAGMAVAQIPDMKNWEATAKIAEADRGHIAIGQPVQLTAVSMPDRPLRGTVKDLGGTGGPPWDRRFECRIAVQDPVPELRAGMTVNIVITEETLKDVLWVPAQALFDSDGRTIVYVRTPQGSFTSQDAKLVRRSESQVVVDGVKEGQVVALASPGRQNDKASKKSGRTATQALTK